MQHVVPLHSSRRAFLQLLLFFITLVSITILAFYKTAEKIVYC